MSTYNELVDRQVDEQIVLFNRWSSITCGNDESRRRNLSRCKHLIRKMTNTQARGRVQARLRVLEKGE